MPRRSKNIMFKQTDVTRAFRAAQAAGINNPRIEISNTGTIVIIPQPGDADDDSSSPNPWDKDAQNKKRSA